MTKHHRNPIARSSCCTHFDKIFATLTKQLASQIIEPVLLICVDSGTPFLHIWGSLVMPLGTLGITFGSTKGHQKGHLGPPWRTCATKHQKDPTKSLFQDPFWDPNSMTFLVSSVLDSTCLQSEANDVQMSQKRAEKGCLNYKPLTATLKCRNCVSAAPARADRGPGLPKNIKTITKNYMRTNTPRT